MKKLAVLGSLVALLATSLLATAAGGRPEATTSLTVYSGRDERFVGAIYKRFKTLTGIELNVRYGDSAALAAALARGRWEQPRRRVRLAGRGRARRGRDPRPAHGPAAGAAEPGARALPRPR